MEADEFQEEEDEEMAETEVDSQVRIEPPPSTPSPPIVRSCNAVFSRFTLSAIPAPNRIVLRKPQLCGILSPKLHFIEQLLIYLT